MPSRRLLFQLTFTFYEAPDLPGTTCAHCLELDVVGQGVDNDEARGSLMDAIELYVQCKVEHRELSTLFSPAPADVWNATDVERWCHLVEVTIPPRQSTKKPQKAKRAEVAFIQRTHLAHSGQLAPTR
jgi:hypothetical protein